MTGKRFIVAALWNHSELTKRFLESLRDQSGLEWTAILVDNGSSDDTSEVVKSFQSGLRLKIEYFTNDENLGCSRAWNRGLREALGRNPSVVGVLNNDVVFAPEWDRELMEFHLRDSSPVFSPHILTGPLETFNERARSFMARNRSRVRYRMRSEALFFEPWVFKKVGLYDERYFVSHEDLDLFLRLDAAGIHPVSTGASVVWHLEKSSRKDLPGHELEARKLFTAKWGEEALRHPGFEIPRWRRRIWRWRERFGIL